MLEGIVVSCKLVNGEEVIGRFISYGDDGLTIDQPMLVVINVQGQIQFHSYKTFSLAEEQKQKFKESLIVTYYEIDNQDILKAYKQSVENSKKTRLNKRSGLILNEKK